MPDQAIPASYVREIRRGVWRVLAARGGRGDRRRRSDTVYGIGRDGRQRAERRYWELVDQLDKGPPDPATQHTVRQTLDAWWRDVVVTQAATTQANRQGARRALAAVLGDLTLDALTVEAYLRVERDWRETLRPGTLRLRRTVLRAALRHAQRQHWLDRDPLVLLPPLNPYAVPRQPARTQASREPLTEAHCLAFLATLEQPEWRRWRAQWLVALFGGLRHGELRGLRRQDVDAEHNVLLIRRQVTRAAGRNVEKAPKNERTREAPVPPEVMAAVVEHLATHEHERVFCANQGQPLNMDEAAKVLYKIEEAAGVPQTAPHGLRHSFVTLALELNAPLQAVSHVAGHASSKITTDTYTKYRRRAGQRVADRLGVLFRRETGPK